MWGKSEVSAFISCWWNCNFTIYENDFQLVCFQNVESCQILLGSKYHLQNCNFKTSSFVFGEIQMIILWKGCKLMYFRRSLEALFEISSLPNLVRSERPLSNHSECPSPLHTNRKSACDIEFSVALGWSWFELIAILLHILWEWNCVQNSGTDKNYKKLFST